MRVSPEMLGAVSTVAATVLAAMALLIQGLNGRSRRKAADAVISAEAFAARSTIRGWKNQIAHLQAVSGSPPSSVMPQEHGEVQDRLLRAVSQAAHGSRKAAKAIRKAYALFIRASGTGRVLTAADLRHKNPAEQETEYKAASREMAQCVEWLTRAIEPSLRDL